MHEKCVEDKTIYMLRSRFEPFKKVFSYMTNDASIEIGDTVEVPVNDEVSTGKVVSVGQYSRIAVPYPVENTKCIIRKVEEVKGEVMERCEFKDDMNFAVAEVNKKQNP